MVEQEAEVVGGVRMAATVRACERVLGFVESVHAGEQDAELERAVGVPAFVGAPVCSGSTAQIAPVLEQQAELRGGGCVAATVCACEGVFGLGEPVLIQEQDAELERAVRVLTLADVAISRHGISQLATPIVLAFATGRRSAPPWPYLNSWCGAFPKLPRVLASCRTGKRLPSPEPNRRTDAPVHSRGA